MGRLFDLLILSFGLKWGGYCVDQKGKKGVSMVTVTIKLPEDIAAQLETEQISPEQLDSFLVAAIQAWLTRRQAVQEQTEETQERPWSEVFQESAVAFADQLIDENQALFKEMARP
jgi:mannitol-1-phosphate/altronate dehydrogenase